MAVTPIPSLNPIDDANVMTRWCAAVGLTAADIRRDGFDILHHQPEGEHVALYRRFDDDLLRPPRRLAVEVLPSPCAVHPETPTILPGRVNVTAGRRGWIDARLCEPEVRTTPSVSVAVTFDPGDQDAALAALEQIVADARAQIEETRTP